MESSFLPRLQAGVLCGETEWFPKAAGSKYMILWEPHAYSPYLPCSAFKWVLSPTSAALERQCGPRLRVMLSHTQQVFKEELPWAMWAHVPVESMWVTRLLCKSVALFLLEPP